MTSTTGYLTQQIQAAGVVIDGVGTNPDQSYRVDFPEGTSAEDIAIAEAIVDAFDPVDLAVLNETNDSDRKAEQVRARFKTRGKDGTYSEQRGEVNKFVQRNEPPTVQDKDYPRAAQRGVDVETSTRETLLEWKAETINNDVIDIDIESITTRGKKSLDAATTKEEAEAIGVAVRAALDAIRP